MRSSSGLAIGLVVGVVVGAAAMYLALERPWRSGGATASAGADGGVSDAGAGAVAKGKKKRSKRGGRGGGGGGGGGDVQAELGEETAPIELSEADKRMSWKGDSVARPPAALDMSGGGDEAGGRALTSGEINATVSRDGGLQRCVEQALDGAPFTGEITVQLLVDGSGNVTRARVQAPAFMHGNGVLACVRRAGKGLSFAATGGYTVVTVPFPISY